MHFRLLGPLRFTANGRPVELGAPLQRTVLAALLIRPGFVVSVPQLVQALWAEDPPATAVKNVQGYVHRLRRLLGDLPDVRLRTVGGGYTLDVDPHQTDVHRFRELVEAAARTGPDESDRLLGQALSMWTGPALADVRSAGLRPVAEQLDAERLAAVEAQAQARLDTGRHLETVSALIQLVREHPLREPARGLLMLALYRAGRHAEALTVYRAGRDVLARELGIEPGPALALLHQQILRRDPALDGGATASRRAPTRQRPSRPAPTGSRLVGRQAELAQLEAVAAGTAGTRLAVIDGLAGVGKTALALRWAAQCRADYPGGLLYVDLRGFDALQPPLTTTEILSRLLAAVPGADGPEPTDPALRLAHWHRLMESRRCLLVLDNAASADQIREVLPRTGPTMTVVTSRHNLAGLVATHGAYRIGLPVLTDADSTALLTNVLTAKRVNREPEAVARLAAGCGHLPLALLIAAAHLLTRPDRSIAELAQRLDGTDRLEALKVDGDSGANVRAALALSDASLDPADSRALRQLALLPGRDLDLAAASALCDLPPEKAAGTLGRLIDAHLVEARPGERYGLHDLVRAYSIERGDEDLGPDGRRAALARLLTHYRATVAAAAAAAGLPRLLVPENAEPAEPAAVFAGPEPALDWLETERGNLVAAIHATVDVDPAGAWRLAVLMRGFLRQRRYAADWVCVATDGLAAARSLDDVRARAACWHNLGHAYWSCGRYTEATDCYQHALADSRTAGWNDGHIGSLSALGAVSHERGRHDEAIDYYQRSLALPGGDQSGVQTLITTGSLGLVYQTTGRIREALDAFRATLRHAEELGSTDFTATSLGNIGGCELSLGRWSEAAASLDRALALYRQVGSRNGEANVLVILSLLQARTGRSEDAAYYSTLALRLARDIGDQRIESDALMAAGVAAYCREDWAAAEEQLSAAVSLAERCGYERGLPDSMVELARVRLRLGDQRQALRTAERAWHSADEMRHAPSLAAAAAVLAEVHLQLGSYGTAAEWATRAWNNADGTALPPLQARALTVQADIVEATSGPAAAAPLRARAAGLAQAPGTGQRAD